jgi:hypothetical protein
MAEICIFPMAIKFTTIFYFRTLQILPKVGFLGLKIYHLATLVNRFLPLNDLASRLHASLGSQISVRTPLIGNIDFLFNTIVLLVLLFGHKSNYHI